MLCVQVTTSPAGLPTDPVQGSHCGDEHCRFPRKPQLVANAAAQLLVPHVVVEKVEEASFLLDSITDRIGMKDAFRRRDIHRLIDAVKDVLRPAEHLLVEADGRLKWQYASNFGGRNEAYLSNSETDQKTVEALIRQLRLLQSATPNLDNGDRQEIYVNRLMIRSIRLHLRDGFGIEVSA